SRSRVGTVTRIRPSANDSSAHAAAVIVLPDPVGVFVSVSGVVLGSVSGLGFCGPGRFGFLYGVLSGDGWALVLDKQ
ncbi:hypothetical protein ACIO6T_43170, partial [Streptomyces sp. NPDC087532]|uniref:hypothetical protein n=1 Tax=Streptomyces sp. NPDC087532 TaxID=3365795 RepID=UPI0038037C2D